MLPPKMYNNSMKYLVLLVGALVVFLGAGGNRSVAQQLKTGISVAPAIIDVAINPGETQNRQITIRNTNEFAIPISFEVQQLVSNDAIFDNASALSSASDWITISDSALLFAGGDTKKINLGISIPEDASPGGHYAQISIRALSLEQNNSGESSIVVPEITASVFITVAGDIVDNFEFGERISVHPFSRLNSENSIDFSIRNIGNTHGLITPILVISDKEGQVVHEEQLTVKLILPGTTKNYLESWQVPTAYGKYEARLEFKIGGTNYTVYSPPETFIVTHSFVTIIVVGAGTIILVHLTRKRKNIRGALRILFATVK